MYCVIQETQRKKPNKNGANKILEAYSPFDLNGKTKYSYQFTGERFERPIATAYKISIHESRRVNGVVTKKQIPITTVGYYDLVEWWIGDCVQTGKVESAAEALGVSIEAVWAAIDAKVNPLQERIKAKFAKTEEYKTKAKHDRILKKYFAKRTAFSKAYGVSIDVYDFCYNVFGEVMNQSYIDEIIEANKRRQSSSSYRDRNQSNYGNSSQYSSYFQTASSTYFQYCFLSLYCFSNLSSLLF